MTFEEEVLCACCGLIYRSSWSQEEAAAHAAKVFGSPPPEDAPTVCEDCYIDIMRWAKARNLPLRWAP